MKINAHNPNNANNDGRLSIFHLDPVKIFADSFLASVEQHGRAYELGLMASYMTRSGRVFTDVDLAPQVLMRGKLPFKHGVELACFTLFKGFADAQQHVKAVFKGKNSFAGHKGIVFTHDLAAFRMPGENPACTSITQHGGRGFARKRAFFGRVAVLATGRKGRLAVKGIGHAADAGKRRKNNNFVPGWQLTKTLGQFTCALAGLGAGFIHLPVGGKYFLHGIPKYQMEQR